MKIQLPDYSQVSVLVAGDVMLDRYWTGDTGRISPEAPVPVVKVGEQEQRPGGAGNVALNITSLGARTTVMGVCGNDEAGDLLRQTLSAEQGIELALATTADRPTITKLRILSRHQQLLRLDFEHHFEDRHSKLLLEDFTGHLDTADVVILSDYDKGSLRLAPEFIARARAAGKTVLVDPKSADFSHYRGASLITPNLGEFQRAAGPCHGEQELEQKARALMQEHNIDAMLITRSEHGMSLIQNGQPAMHIPALAREVFDVTGAGDTVIAVLAASLAAGLPVTESAGLANLAAGIVVGKLGAASVIPAELRRALHQLNSAEQDILDEQELLTAVTDARDHGETIVMTNGCFDILHAGHVSYLEAARKLGDRLVVAVNDDDSVRRLKGGQRPIVPLAERMQVVAGLAAVDWVVSFSEDTPERLICQVRPDILVKGGDYRPEDIAGNRCAGDTRVLHFTPGQSTSAIIEAISKTGNEKS